MRVRLKCYALITYCVSAIMLLNLVFIVFLHCGYPCHPYFIDEAAKTLRSGLIWAIELQTVKLDLNLPLFESYKLLTEQTWGYHIAGVNLNCQNWSSHPQDLRQAQWASVNLTGSKTHAHVRVRDGILRAQKVIATAHCIGFHLSTESKAS